MAISNWLMSLKDSKELQRHGVNGVFSVPCVNDSTETTEPPCWILGGLAATDGRKSHVSFLLLFLSFRFVFPCLPHNSYKPPTRSEGPCALRGHQTVNKGPRLPGPASCLSAMTSGHCGIQGASAGPWEGDDGRTHKLWESLAHRFNPSTQTGTANKCAATLRAAPPWATPLAPRQRRF